VKQETVINNTFLNAVVVVVFLPQLHYYRLLLGEIPMADADAAS
jgi:hypothetical protein